jgi:ribosome-binding protein aMBF1 (putative translation factor)
MGRENDKKNSIKKNKFIGTSFDDDLKRRLEEDEEFKILFERESFLNDISNKIVDLREKEGLSQYDVAEKAGMKQSAIARLESSKNTRTPSLDLLNKIASSLGKKVVISFVDSKEEMKQSHC